VAAAQQPAIVLVDTATGLRQLSWTTYFSSAMAILFLFFAVQAGMLSLFEERRQGTLARILAGPIRPGTILWGKALGSFVTGVTSMAVLIVATTLLLGADWGPPLGVALIVAAAVTSAIGITTLVTSFLKTFDGASAANAAVAMTLGILGGTFSPTAQAPEAMQTLSLLTPHAWFLRGLAEMQGGGTIADALPAVAVLLAVGLVTGAIGFARARRLVAAR
jgi:linearmycin/streptolysin S transport system permease protein